MALRLATEEEIAFQDLAACTSEQLNQTRLPWHEHTRVIAIGDIHGDYRLAVTLFRQAGLINDRFDWIAPAGTIVVQVGDQIDDYRPGGTKSGQSDPSQTHRPPQDLDVIVFFRTMDARARAQNNGCAVYSLIGNHEILNVRGDFRYVSANNRNDLRYGKDGRKDAFRAGGPIARMFACERPTILVIGDNLFVHGGISEKIDTVLSEGLAGESYCSEQLLLHPDQPCDILTELNRRIRNWLWNNANDYQRSRTDLWLHEEVSPLWYRGQGKLEPGSTISDQLERAMNVWGVKTMIIGHTVQAHSSQRSGTVLNHISSRTKRPAIYRIDGGFSSAFHDREARKSTRTIEYLLIENQSEYHVVTHEMEMFQEIPSIIPEGWVV